VRNGQEDETDGQEIAMSDESTDAPQDQRVEIDDPFEVPEDVEQAWEDEEVDEGEAPCG
jgi:hypothetical protein